MLIISLVLLYVLSLSPDKLRYLLHAFTMNVLNQNYCQIFPLINVHYTTHVCLWILNELH